jgi:hypothetical protein
MFQKQQKWSPPGAARLHPKRANQRPNVALRSSHASASEKVHHQSNHRYDEQKMNQPPGNVEREKPQHPQHKQNKKQR